MIRVLSIISFFPLFCCSLQGQSISNITPVLGAAFFPVIIEGNNLGAVDNVIFEGGSAVCFYVYPSGKKIQAIAPNGVKTGPVVVAIGDDSLKTGDFVVIENANPDIDFNDRDALPQTDLPEYEWCSAGTWGPSRASSYPDPPEPPEEVDRRLWLQARVIAAALKWRYLPYRHHHIPAFDATLCTNLSFEYQVGPGLDCSNYTSWIYLYAFNHVMSSAIRTQAASDEAGRLLSYGDELEPGDLLFSKGSPSGTNVTHVSVYIDPNHRIDETSGLCDIRPWRESAWPYNSFHSARRPLDLIEEKIVSVDKVREESLTLYPNPASDVVTVGGLEKGDELKLVSLQGIVYISSIIYSNEPFKTDISELPEGAYILTVLHDDRVMTVTFTKVE